MRQKFVDMEFRADRKDLMQLAGEMRRRNNNVLSTIYTQLEAVLPEGRQLEALKELVKWEVWRCTDDNQNYMYELFRGTFDTTGLEPVSEDK